MKFLPILCLFLPVYCAAQLSLSGTVLDVDQPVPYANIVLLANGDSLTAGTITDDDGRFSLQAPAGNYTLEISQLNYQSLRLDFPLRTDTVLSPLTLRERAEALGKVVVAASRLTVRRKLDRTVVNIEDSPLAQSGDLFEALRSTPGLVVRNESIAMLGKSSVRVSVDGRMIELSGEDLANFLRSFAAGDVKAIEIITNPPARYRAEGNSGIVNIVTKNVRTNAWSNRLSATHNQARLGWHAFNNSFSYQKNKLSLLATVTHNAGKQYIRQVVIPEYTENPQRIDSRQDIRLQSWSPRLLLDYRINETTTVGVQYLGSYTRSRTLDDLKITVLNRDRSVNRFLLADNVEYFPDRDNASYNLFFTKQLDTLGRRVTLNLDLLNYDGTTRTDVVSNAFDPDLNFLGTEFANRGEATYRIDNYNLKLDVEHPLPWVNLSYGGRSSFSNTRYRLNNFDTSDGASVFSPERSNAFAFSEDIQALYLNTVKQFSDRWEAQFGLRAEFAQTVGTSPEDERAEPLFTNNYGQLFPTFYVQYTQNDDHVYSFNYGKRINRPAYSQLNPARSFLSAQSSQQGNPFLLPSFSHNVEFAYVHRGNLTATLTFQYVKDAYSFIFDLDDANQEQIITYRNVYDQQLASLQLRYQLDLTPWWTTRLFFYGDVNQSDKINPEDNLTLDGSGRYYLSSNNQFTLHEARNISGEINFWYDSPYRANLYRFGRASALNVALNWRSFLPGADLTVGVYDVLNTSPRTVASTINGIEHNFRAFPSNRYLRFSLAYRFGNENIRADGRDFGNEEVRQRSN